jgi:DNA-binding NtrC family response regulator
LRGQILVIEDDKILNRLIVQHLALIGFEVFSAPNWKGAGEYFSQYEPKLVIMDVQLPDANGVDLLNKLALEVPVIVLTAFGSVRDAVQAIKAGASEYLVKPITLDELELMVERTLANADLRLAHQFCRERLQSKSDHFMVGDSSALRKVQKLIDAVSPNDISVLIQGESGVGKELVAQAIHECSPRSKRNFIAVDCCTLQEKLFESEVFGHERGAFTDAKQQKKGLIEGAEGGTLFLDEIGEIEPAIQAKLLRVLETGKFRRLGGTKDLQANVRIVAATNRDLEEMSKSGEFRADLYYRLAGFVINVPPLRKRRDDIRALTDHFIQNHNFSRRINTHITKSAMQILIAYHWPGNIRELKNVVERAIILAGSARKIRKEHLSLCASQLNSDPDLSLSFDAQPTLRDIEKKYLGMLLERYSGHRLQIAEILGISERSVYRMVEKYGFKQEQLFDDGAGKLDQGSC